VAIGAKRVETRSWQTAYRGPLAIHAAAGLGPVGGKKGLTLTCARKYFLPALDVVMPKHLRGIGSPASIADLLPRGAIVAVCILVDCRAAPGYLAAGWEYYDGRIWRLTEQERAFGDYSPGRYAWLLADVRPLPEPIPCKGALSLWELDTLTQLAIKRQQIAGVSNAR
jgi:hypothetical protein